MRMATEEDGPSEAEDDRKFVMQDKMHASDSPRIDLKVDSNASRCPQTSSSAVDMVGLFRQLNWLRWRRTLESPTTVYFDMLELKWNKKTVSERQLTA